MASISGKAANFGMPENKFKYNGIEFETDLDLIVYDAFYRELDPQTGKWWEIDPKWEKDMENWGAYVSNFSNPIRNKDPKGDCPKCDEVFKDVKSSVKETLVSAYDGAVSVARELNQFNPLANLYEVISGKSIASDFTQPKPRLMAVADMGVNTLMLFGPKVALGFSTEAKVVNGGRVAASAENATAKEGSRFISDGAGNVLDTKAFQGLKEVSSVVKGSRGATKPPLFGKPGTFANLGNGHKIVFGSDGRALFDVSANRIKGIKWNQAPNGRWFPAKGADTKFQGPVPKSILNALGF